MSGGRWKQQRSVLAAALPEYASRGHADVVAAFHRDRHRFDGTYADRTHHEALVPLLHWRPPLPRDTNGAARADRGRSSWAKAVAPRPGAKRFR
jgi:hypothetical protein